MVLIAASICTKNGKVIVSRQFVEMSKVRIEGLLAAFPKLVSTDKQHTFVETDSVRYVYQPMDKIYMLLITTKASNILEDLETLRLFSRVIPEYCRSMDENDICENSFNLIFAFDEIVALGYRETVNLAQIRTFVEMDSHEEKVYQAVRQTQEREAKNKMREKAKELQRLKMEANKKITKSASNYSTFAGGSSSYMSTPTVVDASINLEVKPQPFTAVQVGDKPKSLKLGSKSKNVESFVDQLKSEGEVVSSVTKIEASSKITALTSNIDMEDVHLKEEERLSVHIKRDGGINSFELSGIMSLHIKNENFCKIYIALHKCDDRNVQIQTHPNVDKEAFKSKSQIRLKNYSKPFPLNTDVAVLKWRLQTTDEDTIPLSVTCWPSDNGEGGCDVTIEYELLKLYMELNNVVIHIPLPVGSNPVVSECTGDYEIEGKHMIMWTLPIIDNSNRSGSIEFSATSCIPTDIYPINIEFTSKTSYSKIKVADVNLLENSNPVNFSTETICYSEKYEVS